MARKTKKKKLTPLEREIKRREAAVNGNDRRIARIRREADADIYAIEQKNKTHREILAKLKK